MEITLYYQRKEYPPRSVIPAKAGIQCFVWFPASAGTSLDSRFHGNDKKVAVGLRMEKERVFELIKEVLSRDSRLIF